MKLYYSKGTCSLAVRIALHEIGIKAQYEAVNLKIKQTESGKDFLKINAKGAVPALELDNGEILTENAVIQQYLADLHHATTVLPEVGNFKRYRVLEWLNYVSTEIHKGCGALFHPKIPQTVKDEVFIPMLKAKFDYLDAHFANSPFLLDHFTLPDGYLFVILSWLPKFNIDINDWKNVSRYITDVKNRSSVKAALQEEQLL